MAMHGMSITYSYIYTYTLDVLEVVKSLAVGVVVATTQKYKLICRQYKYCYEIIGLQYYYTR